MSRSIMRPSILLFGDSLTQQSFGKLDEGIRFGWASLLASTYTRRADVLSRGFSGYNTRHALDILPTSIYPILDQHRETNNQPPLLFCSVFLGANDAALPGMRQYVPLEEYTSNIKKIVTQISERYSNGGSEEDTSSKKELPIILMTPPPVHNTKWKAFCQTTDRNEHERSNQNTRMYGTSVISIGKELNIPVLDTFELLKGHKEEKEYEDFVTDGLHLTEQGQTIIYDGLMKLLEETYPHLVPDTINPELGLKLEEKEWTELC